MSDRKTRPAEAFRTAETGLEPAMERLIGAVPDLVGEARRRRAAAAAAPPDFLGTLIPLAWKALPRLGAAAALLLAASTVLFFNAAEVATTARVDSTSTESGFESWILTGSPSTDFDDPLLEAITTGEDG